MKTLTVPKARRGAVRAFTAALVVATGTIAGSAGADPTPLPIVVGKLLLDLRAPNAFVYGSITEPLTTISNKDRRLVFSGATLAVIGPDGQAAFLDKNGKEWIGINSNGLFSGRNQIGDPALVLSLVSAADSSTGKTPPYWSEIKQLQFNAKHNAVFDLLLKKGGAEGTSYRVFTGTSIDSEYPSWAGPKLKCAEGDGADSNPDSDSINCTIGPIIEDADTIVFSTFSGDWSLGGQDSVSEFDFIQEPTGQIACGDQTVAVGNGITEPFAQCTRLYNGASTLGTPDAPPACDPENPDDPTCNCAVVNYSLETSCDGPDCRVQLLYGLSGTQDATQFRWLCTANWVDESVTFQSASPNLSEPLTLSEQYWGTQNSTSTRPLDYCPGALIETDPPGCEPGTVAVTSSSLSYGGFTITADDVDLTQYFQVSDVIAITGVTGYYKIASLSYDDSAGLSTVILDMDDHMLSSSDTDATGTITRVSGCSIVGFDFSGLSSQSAEIDDMSSTLPGKQRGCLLEQRETQCNSEGGSPTALCLQQTWGWEGDAMIRRF